MMEMVTIQDNLVIKIGTYSITGKELILTSWKLSLLLLSWLSLLLLINHYGLQLLDMSSSLAEFCMVWDTVIWDQREDYQVLSYGTQDYQPYLLELLLHQFSGFHQHQILNLIHILLEFYQLVQLNLYNYMLLKFDIYISRESLIFKCFVSNLNTLNLKF